MRAAKASKCAESAARRARRSCSTRKRTSHCFATAASDSVRGRLTTSLWSMPTLRVLFTQSGDTTLVNGTTTVPVSVSLRLYAAPRLPYVGLLYWFSTVNLTPFLLISFLISSLCDSRSNSGTTLTPFFFSDSVDSTFLFFSSVPSVRTAHTAHPVRTHFDTRGTTAARALDPGDSRRSTTSLVCRSPTGPLHPTSVPLSPP